MLDKVRAVFKTARHVVIYPASGTGAWEAALANTLSPGDRVLMCETGWFATCGGRWRRGSASARFIAGDWRRGADPAQIEARLREDKEHAIKAVCVVHNETSTGATSPHRRGAPRDRRRRPPGAAAGGHHLLARLHRLPPRRVGRRRHRRRQPEGADAAARACPSTRSRAKALKASRDGAKLPRSSGTGGRCSAANETGYFPYTPATNLLYGLDAAVDMLLEEGLDNVFARHDRHAEATRRAVRAWGLEIQCEEPRHYSSGLTAVRLPEGHSADALRATILERLNMSLGNGLGPLKDRVFRIGHLGDFGDLQLVGTLGGVEMGLRAAGVPHKPGGVQAAMARLGAEATAASGAGAH